MLHGVADVTSRARLTNEQYYALSRLLQVSRLLEESASTNRMTSREVKSALMDQKGLYNNHIHSNVIL
jgi:hypothetical protein